MKPMKPSLSIGRGGRCTLKIDAGDLASLLKDAASGESMHTSRPMEHDVKALSEQLANWFILWHDDSSTVFLADDVIQTYANIAGRPLIEVLD